MKSIWFVICLFTSFFIQMSIVSGNSEDIKAGGPVAVIEENMVGGSPDKGYIVIVYPVEPGDPVLWVMIEGKVFYEKGEGIKTKKGYTYEPVLASLFNRSGQMAFEVAEGRYRIALYSDPKFRFRVTKNKTFPMEMGEIESYKYPRPKSDKK
ncbi:MAG: hypothetical protein P9M03_11715 [Candidatus Theseobacter exili]|nr:hypothetical protein [Candidatus Theseobacter exili]